MQLEERLKKSEEDLKESQQQNKDAEEVLDRTMADFVSLFWLGILLINLGYF